VTRRGYSKEEGVPPFESAPSAFLEIELLDEYKI